MRIAWLALYVSILLLLTVNAQAQLLFTITPGNQTANAGGTVTFTATLKNTGSSDLFLNGTSWTLPGPGLSIDDAKFFNAPLPLMGGEEWSGELFDVLVDPAAAPGDYDGTFNILGGTDSGAQILLSSQPFSVAVQSPAAAVPEPGVWAFPGMISMPLGLILLRRRKQGRDRSPTSSRPDR